MLSVKIATLTCLLFLLMCGWGRRTGVRCVNLGAFTDLQVLDELGQSVYLAEWEGHNLGDIASKTVFENTRYVADLLVFCQEKLRRYFDMNYFCQLTIIDIWVLWPWSHQAWGIKSSWLPDFQGISCWVSLWLCVFYSFHLKVKRSMFWILLKYRLLETVITWF